MGNEFYRKAAINYSSFKKYGCPYCGCDEALQSGPIQGGSTNIIRCRECRKEFLLMADDANSKSSIGFYIGKDENGKDIYDYPEVKDHPRKGTPKHAFIPPDPRPEEGEYWRSRGIGYDLAGFVRSKSAGLRILLMVMKVLGNDNPTSWLDYRKDEPEWIQFKFQKEEFNLELLDKLTSEAGGIVTLEMLEKCKLEPDKEDI